MLNNNIIEIIDRKNEEIKKKHNNFFSIEFIFPYIGCNANCFYCFQKNVVGSKFNSELNSDFNIEKNIRDKFKHIKNFANRNNLIFDEIFIMGGELKILSLENQLRLINLINELKKDYKINLFVNDTKMDSPLMKIKDVCYIVHILNWKNRNLLDLDKKLNETNSKFIYKIVITDKDTEEEVTKFLEINKEIREKLSFNIDDTDTDDLSKKRLLINKYLKYGKKFINFEQCIYKCKKYYKKLLSFSIENEKMFFKRCCYEPEKEFFSFKELDNIIKNEINCKYCNDVVNNTFFEFI